MNKLLLSATRHFFAQCVFMNSIHYKAYNRVNERQNLYRTVTLAIAGATVVLIASELLAMRVLNDKSILNNTLDILANLGLVFTASSLIFNFYQKVDLCELKLQHRIAAEAYKQLRDEYMMLIEQIMSNSVQENELRSKSTQLQIEYSRIGKSTPTTTGDDYAEAQNGLGIGSNDNEEFTWSNDEINRFLPKELRF